jgi:uncharacterized phage protein gp47/JayE
MLDRAEQHAKGQGMIIDRRTASMIYFALAPAAVEILQMYIEIDNVLNESFADTETRDFLIRRCEERGITAYPATFAIRRGEFNLDVPIGSRYSLNKLNYIVIAPIEGEPHNFQTRCETAGNAGNIESGALIPIDYVDGLTFARLTDVLIPAEEDEGTEHLRQRYFDSLNAQAYGGNIQDYVEKTLSIGGVGGVKVYPIWQGGGTVKLVILNSQFQIPSETLIDAVQTEIDPVSNQGVGMGAAPIGHVVTVEGVTAETVDVHFNITFKDGWDWESVKPYVEQAVDGYFTDLSAGWDKVKWRDDPNAALIVRISQIETRILALTGVLDVQNTTLNGEAANLTLDVDCIAVMGEVTNG